MHAHFVYYIPQLPLVVSFSYGASERLFAQTPGRLAHLNHIFQILGLMGMQHALD